MGDLGLHHFVGLSAILFALGLYCVLTRRNAIGILMGIELGIYQSFETIDVEATDRLRL